MNEITLQAFKERLKEHYLHDNGERAAEEIIENFSKIAIAKNKGNNPFFYTVLLSTIKQSNISLTELQDTNNSVIKQVFIVVERKSTEYKEKVSKPSDNKPLNDVKQVAGEKTAEEILEQKQKVDEYIEKYGGFEKFLHKATKNELDTYIKVRKSEKVLSDADAILMKLINNPEIQLTEEEKQTLKHSKVGQKFGYDQEKGFNLELEAREYSLQLEKFREYIERIVELGETNLSKEQLEKLRKGRTYHLVCGIKSDQEIVEMVEKIAEDYRKIQEIGSPNKAKDELETIGSLQPLKEELRIEVVNYPETSIDLENLGDEVLCDMLAMQARIEAVLNNEFENMEDPALDNTQRHNGELIQEIGSKHIKPEDAIKEVLAKDEEFIKTQPEETEYKAPTIKVEKKGLAKLFDRLQQSKNPLARLITGKIGKNQKLLDSADSQKTETQYEEKPSKGRFGVGDADLMPTGINVRNGIIRAAEAIARLVRRNKEPNELTNTMVPVQVSNKFEASFKVDDSVKEQTVKVGIEAGQKAQNSVIIPKEVDSKKKSAPVAPEEH